MAVKKCFDPEPSWTGTRDYERQQEHDFANLLSELGYAIRRQDLMLAAYCELELKRMYRERR